VQIQAVLHIVAPLSGTGSRYICTLLFEVAKIMESVPIVLYNSSHCRALAASLSQLRQHQRVTVLISMGL
jgi:hypothetical protein